MAPPAAKDEAARTTMSNNLWVGNIGRDVTDSDLMDIFSQYGALDGVTSYSSRSYAFVLFKRKEDAAAAKEALQGTLVRGQPVKIEFARPVRIDNLSFCFCFFFTLLFLYGNSLCRFVEPTILGLYDYDYSFKLSLF